MDLDAAIFNALRWVSATRVGDRLLDRALAPFNHFSSRRYIDPYPLYDRVRALAPAYWHRRARMWIVTGYDETLQVLRGPVSVDRRNMVTGLSPYRHMDPANANLMLSNMLMQDPPDHTRLRRTVNRGFTPRAVRVMQDRIDASASSVVAELAAGGHDRAIDIVAATRELPVRMICDLLGVPEADRPRMVAIADVLSQFADPVTGFDPDEMDRAVTDLSQLVAGYVAERSDPVDVLVDSAVDVPVGAGSGRGAGGTDLISALLKPEGEEGALDRDEVISMVGLLLIAGQETTSGLIGNAIVALDRFPEQRRTLLELGDDSRPIEELLRYDSPIQATDRTMVEDLRMEDGTHLREGDVVVLCIGGANRDPRQYERPNELLLDRDDPRPLSFGHGPHHCLGAALARLQSRAVLSEFVTAFPEYRVDRSGVAWKRSTTLRGPAAVPVLLDG
ncbi:MAG: cytochrome P450 [Actinomycetota bacterium]